VSEVLAKLIPARNGRAPTLQVKCRCGRVYVTTCWPGDAKRYVCCIVCRPRSEGRFTSLQDLSDPPPER
jgi:hypothetical protein